MSLSHTQELPHSGWWLRNLKVNIDERGFLSEIIRYDWIEDDIMQVNISESNPGVVRAWHRHSKGQVDYIVVLKGIIEVWLKMTKSLKPDKIILDSEKPQLLRIPGFYWHGYKVINGPTRVLYFLSKLYDYENPDEERMEYKE